MRNAPPVFHGTLTSPEGVLLGQTHNAFGSRDALRDLVEIAAADAGCDPDLIDFRDEGDELLHGGVVLGTVVIGIAGSLAR